MFLQNKYIFFFTNIENIKPIDIGITMSCVEGYNIPDYIIYIHTISMVFYIDKYV